MKTPSPRLLAASLIALLAVVSSPGCDGKSPTTPTLPNGEVTPRFLYAASSSGLTDSERRIVRTQAAYEELQAEIFANEPMAEELDEVDFNRNMVLAVASGEQPVACHTISITSASGDGIDLTVTVTETGPTAECLCAAMVSQPVEVVEVPRADEVNFFTATATACPS